MKLSLVTVAAALLLAATAQAAPPKLTMPTVRHALHVYAHGNQYTATNCVRHSAATVDCLVHYRDVEGLAVGAYGNYEDRQRVALRRGHLWVFSPWTVAERIR